MAGSATERVGRVRIRAGEREPSTDDVVVEEPLEIRLDGVPVAVTMRTPGHDAELALGFLVTEGVIRDPGAVTSVGHCDENENAVDVRVEPGGAEPPSPRNFYATSSCGVCGKASVDSVRVHAPDLSADDTTVAAALLARLPGELRDAQNVFASTGALHAAGLFDASGERICVREDVGRHNAVDKVVGFAAMRERLPLSGHVLLVSGRAGFEIAQKAHVAGIPIVAAISGPSSLAVELARASGMTLVAFLRGEEMVVYGGEERIR
jgi:FdhD protein